ncbi:MAG: biopolymer transporter ExbD [Planctomycetaceae bacterium]|nr:biopolymer transporter ExbD [Planctomycetaceae bacterium]
MPLKTHQDEQPTLNLTPMIDIVFLLIIFFMVGTKFAEIERTVQLEVPKVGDLGALSSAPEKRVINVYNDGSIVVDRRSITLEQLRAELKSATAQYPELGVVVRGDGAGPFQNVASVLTACRQAGIDDMGISVRLDR